MDYSKIVPYCHQRHAKRYTCSDSQQSNANFATPAVDAVANASSSSGDAKVACEPSIST